MNPFSGNSRPKAERANWRSVPAGIRIGGAFVAVGVVLFVFAFIEMFFRGWMLPFPVTPGFLLIVLASMILGGFATTSRYEEGNRTQVTALIVAVVMVILSRFLPAEPLFWMAQFWLSAYGVAAVLCGLVIRRALLPK